MAQNPILLGGVESNHPFDEQLAVTHMSDARAEGRHPVGVRGALPDGRVFYYGKSGDGSIGGALTRAKLAISPNMMLHADHDNVAITTSRAIGDRIITVDLPTTDTPANFYKDGYIWVNDATGEGQYWKIVDHSELDTSVAGSLVTVTLEREIKTALTTAVSEITIVRNPFDHLGLSTTAVQEFVCGIPACDVTASGARTASASTGASVTSITSYFAWIQTAGAAAVLVGDTSSLGVPVMSGTAAGEVEDWLQNTGTGAPAAADIEAFFVGVMMQQGDADGSYGLVDLRIKW